MSEKLTKAMLDELNYQWGNSGGCLMDKVMEAIESDREAIRAEVRKEVTEEILKDAMIPEWTAHKGCSGARIVYEYGGFGDVTWESTYRDSGFTLHLRNGGYIMTGTWHKAQTPKTRPMTREEKIKALSKSPYESVTRLVENWEDELSDATINDLMTISDISTEVTE